MTSSEYMRHWQYYLTIEADYENTRRFVTHDEENLKTYSDEFAKITLVAGSEADALFKILCEQNEIKLPQNQEYYQMKQYAQALCAELSYPPPEWWCFSSYIYIRPWRGFSRSKKDAGLEWWRNYTSLKHDRLGAYKNATLETAAEAVTACLFLLQQIKTHVSEYDIYSEYYLNSDCQSDIFITP